MPTAAGIVNTALAMIASQVTVSGANPAFDGSVAGNAAGVLYTPTVAMLLRQINPAFARRTAVLAIPVGATIPPPWAVAYTYPNGCLMLRQLRPAPGSYDPNDPQPVRGAINFDAGLSVKTICTNLANALAVYTSGTVDEGQWDAAFAEAVARRLTNPLANALAGRPDFAVEMLAESERYAGLAELADES